MANTLRFLNLKTAQAKPAVKTADGKYKNRQARKEIVPAEKMAASGGRRKTK
jgi:hypothetical protein